MAARSACAGLRWARRAAQERASRSLVVLSWVRCGPAMSKVTPSILMVPAVRMSMGVGVQSGP